MPTDERALFEERLGRLSELLKKEGLTRLLVFAPLNMRYLTGFTGGEGAVLVSLDEVALVSDFRYRLQAAEESPWVRFVEVEEKLADLLPELFRRGQGALGVEASHLTLSQWRRLEPAFGEVDYRIVDGLVEQLRMVKQPAELAAVREASRLLAGVFQQLARMKVVGRTEVEVALELETWARKQGSGPVPFEYIVAGGARGAMPHGVASRTLIEPDQLLVVDIGTSVEGYASDMTRTFATGPLDEEQTRMYALVARAQTAARACARAGVACAEVDGVARSIITEGGYGEFFKHGLGHGVGLDVHEDPRLSAGSEHILQAGMTVTIEPGVYLPAKGGVRIEDTVAVTEEGIEVLTEFERSLIRLE